MCINWLKNLISPTIRYSDWMVKYISRVDLVMPKKITYFCEVMETDSSVRTVGEDDRVTTGERVQLRHGNDYIMVSPVTGTIQEVYKFTGILGKSFLAVDIEVEEKDEFDGGFGAQLKNPTLLLAKQYLRQIPGTPPFTLLFQNPGAFHTIVVSGVDSDLLLQTQRYFVKNKTNELREGMAILQKITGIDQILLALRENDLEPVTDMGVPILPIKDQYPHGLRHMIAGAVAKKTVLPHREKDVGVCVFTAEAVANIGEAFRYKRVPSRKIMTVMDKKGRRHMASIKTGTHVKDIFERFEFELHEMDRVFVGGPMTGAPIFSENHPIRPMIDGLFVQDSEKVPPINDYPCTNCGDCVRICPVHLPVNMLVLLLESREYHTAAEKYDLFSCLECGLCSYVCMSQIPITQYIEMAKKDVGYRNR